MGSFLTVRESRKQGQVNHEAARSSTNSSVQAHAASSARTFRAPANIMAAPAETPASRCLFIPIKDSEEAVSIPLNEMPNDVEEVNKLSYSLPPDCANHVYQHTLLMPGPRCLPWRNRSFRYLARFCGVLNWVDLSEALPPSVSLSISICLCLCIALVVLYSTCLLKSRRSAASLCSRRLRTAACIAIAWEDDSLGGIRWNTTDRGRFLNSLPLLVKAPALVIAPPLCLPLLPLSNQLAAFGC